MLVELLQQGRLVETRRSVYALPGQQKVQEAQGGASRRTPGYPGRLQSNPAGFGFVIFEDTTRPDLFIPREGMAGAWDGDRVQAVPLPVQGGRKPSGKIVDILERKRQQITGFLRFRKGFAWLAPDDTRLPWVKMVPEGLQDVPEAARIAINLTFPPPTRKSPHPEPFGQIFRVLALSDSLPHEAETEAVMINHGLKATFDPDTLEQAQHIDPAIPASELAQRTDFRSLPVVTIDGPDAKDFDDAVHLEILEPDRWRIGIHVADVSHYVPENSPLDREAYERATSAYLPGRVLPMLPEKLSNGVCSLLPGEDRLVFSVVVEVTPGGRILSQRFERGIIRSVARLTYPQVQGLIEGGSLGAGLEDLHQPLLTLYQLTTRLKANRMRKGALEFNFPEVKVELEGETIHILPQGHPEARSLIEELMLLANRSVARFLVDRGMPALFRVHEDPDPDRFRFLQRAMARLGYVIDADEPSPRALQEVLRQTQGKPEAAVVAALLLRSLKLARYAHENLGHFGLAAEHYLHFTSPIRRYPDLVVHRILADTLRGKSTAGHKARLLEKLPAMADHTSARERAAEAAERELTRYFQCLWAQKHLGEVFTGQISGVTSFGVFVTLDPRSGVEGLVRLSDLTDDHYEFQEEALSLVGQRSGHTLRLGAELEVQIAAANPVLRQIDLVLPKVGEVVVPRSTRNRPASTAAAPVSTGQKRSKPAVEKAVQRGSRKVVGPPVERKSGFDRPVRASVRSIYFGAWGENDLAADNPPSPDPVAAVHKRSRKRRSRRKAGA